MVEFAIIASTLLTLVFIMMDFGIVLYNKNASLDAARVAARWSSRTFVCTACTRTTAPSGSPTDACHVGYAIAAAQMIVPDTLSVTTACGVPMTDAIQVTVSFKGKPFVPAFSAFLAKTYSSQAIFYKE